MSRINYGSFWTKILLNKEEVEKIKLKLNKEITGIERASEYFGRRQNELEDEKSNINKIIAELEKNDENLSKQFDDLDGENFEGPPSYLGDQGPGLLINWKEEAFQSDESGWSGYSRQKYSDYRREIKRREIKNPLPIGSGICYVLSVPENENWSKIGFTTKSAQERAEDYSKQHDLELNVAGIIADDNAAALEKILHEEFSPKRVKHGSAREIFAVPPKECIEKVKSFKRVISEEMQSRQLLLIGAELHKIYAKINKNKYKITSIDETIAETIRTEGNSHLKKLEKIYDLECLSLSSMEIWYRFYGWKPHLKRYSQLLINILKYILIISVFVIFIYQIFD
jgi:hypothetical protein